MKKHNFYAGPSILSEYTIKNTADAVMNFNETGLSILEISHRSKEFQAVIDEANALIKELLEIPSGYEVLFLGGGASMQFCMIPYNFLKTKAAYLDTGVWASKAIKEAKLFGDVNVVASSKDANYTFVPKGYTVPDDVDYFHITTNNTIYGTELREDPDVKVPLIADMSSDIFSRRIDVSKYDAIYAGAQKNLAPSGVTLVIVRRRTRENGPCDSDNARLPHARKQRLNVQHTSMLANLLCTADIEMVQIAWRHRRNGKSRQGESSPAV